MIDRGIILAGGNGTRLSPLTKVTNKQLLPLYDKPIIYYPLSVLMLAGIKDILIISTPHDLPNFVKLFGDGNQFGIKISYAEQPSPDGLAQAFIIGEKFIGNDDVCLILGDNLFYGAGLHKILFDAIEKVKNERTAIVFGKAVPNPEGYGIAEINSKNNVTSIVEKPSKPKSNLAVVGLYFYPNNVIDISKSVKPSKRGELEITSINQKYLELNELKLEILTRGIAWLDTGTQKALSEATEFVKAIENSTGLKIACLEEIALNNNWISKDVILENTSELKGAYYNYIKKL